MSGFSQLGQNLERGYLMGRQTGGRVSNLGSIIGKVADRLRQEREGKQALAEKQNLLGYEGLLKGVIEPTKEGGFEIPGMGRMKTIEQIKAVVNPDTGQIEYTVPKKSVFKPQEKSAITKTTALSILSDPVKSEQLKQTYPEVYSLVESIVTNESQSLPKKTQPPPNPITEGEVKVIKDGKKYALPKSQLEEALKQGYKRIP